jgi:iron uptake system EfeUOB component EfeO/EfeM
MGFAAFPSESKAPYRQSHLKLLPPGRAALFLASACLLACLLSACGSSSNASSVPAPSALERVERGAVQKYRWFLEANAQALVQWTAKLRGQIALGEVTKAESRYATARAQYGRVEQAAAAFKSLHQRIDARPGEIPARELVGFHRIEKSLFAEHTARQLSPVAKSLLADVGKLHHELKKAALRPAAIMASASALMRDTSTSKLAGEGEPYADTDLVDVAANVEGAEAAFEAVRPLLAHEDLALVEAVEAAFAEAYEALKPTGSPAREPQTRPAAAGSVFLLFSELTPTQVAALTKPIATVARLLGEAPDESDLFQRTY